MGEFPGILVMGVGMVVVPRRRRGGEVGIGRYGCWCG